MSDKLHCFLQQQRELLDSGPEAMGTNRSASLVRPAVKVSYIRHFRRIRDLAGIPEDFRPNYCLGDKAASRLLFSGATLDEVAY